MRTLRPSTVSTPIPVSNFQQVFEAEGLSGALLNIFGTHVEYLGLTPAQIADATTSTDGDLTFVNISDSGVNNADAWLTALLEHGVADRRTIAERIPVPGTVVLQYILKFRVMRRTQMGACATARAENSGHDDGPAHRLGDGLPAGQSPNQRGQQCISCLARIDSSLTPSARRIGRKPSARRRAAPPCVVARMRRSAERPRSSRPWSLRDSRTSRLVIEAQQRHDHRSEADALRSVRCSFGDVANVWAAQHPRAAPQYPAPLGPGAGNIPGLSARKTIGRWNASATMMKWAALSAASASMEPASSCGWLATTATGFPPRWASAQMTALPNWGCTSTSPSVEDHVEHATHVVALRLSRGMISSSSGTWRAALVIAIGRVDGG